MTILFEIENEGELARPIARIAYLAMFALTEAERAEVTAFFCRACWRYTGGVVACTCTRDE